MGSSNTVHPTSLVKKMNQPIVLELQSLITLLENTQHVSESIRRSAEHILQKFLSTANEGKMLNV